MDFGSDKIFLPENIRFLRKRMNMSQEELANCVGLNRGNIASYEKGTAEPKICNLLKLARVFRLSILDLTKRDLRDEEQFELASDSFVPVSPEEKAALDGFLNQAEELGVVVNSIYHCHCYKKKNLENADLDTQLLVGNFEQLHQIALNLLKAHKELLEFVKEKAIS